MGIVVRGNGHARVELIKDVDGVWLRGIPGNMIFVHYEYVAAVIAMLAQWRYEHDMVAGSGVVVIDSPSIDAT